jgi:hypothetical protein
VEIIPVGSTTPIQLTKEEYKVSEGGAGNVTNKVQQVQQEREMAQSPLANQQVEQERTIQEKFNEAQLVNSKDIRGTIPGKTLNVIANLIDGITTTLPVDFIKVKDPKSLSDIKEGYNSMSQVINDDIALYKAGAISYSQVQADIDQALAFTIKLQASTVGKGQANLAYWRDEGASIEAEVLKQLRNLENQKRSLGL